jgi:glycosyltransferase involved in cell wall biosynthesis
MKLNFICPINFTSYGLTSVNILHELTKLGDTIALFPIGRPECYIKFEQSVRTSLVNADSFDVDSVCIRLFHQFDLSMFVGHSIHIGFPIFELDTFTDKEKHHLNSCDSLFVCSQWAKDIIGKNCKSSTLLYTDVVPLGVDTEVFTPKMSTRKPTIFLNIGKWEVRKGHDILVELFNEAFSETDNVELWMMCHNPFISHEKDKEWEDKYKNSKLGHKIRIIPRVDSDSQVAHIMQQADCGVFPSRAEGWNLEVLEMMSCGKEVIVTDYSAHTQFCTKENSLLVPIIDTEPAYDGVWFFRQGNWGVLDKPARQSIIEYMQEVHTWKQTGKLTLNEQGIVTAQHFTWKNTAETIIQHLS